MLFPPLVKKKIIEALGLFMTFPQSGCRAESRREQILELSDLFCPMCWGKSQTALGQLRSQVMGNIRQCPSCPLKTKPSLGGEAPGADKLAHSTERRHELPVPLNIQF